MCGWKERGLEKHNKNESSSLLSWHHEWHWSYTEVPSWDLQSVEGAGKAASPLDDGHDKQNMAWPFNLQTLLKPKNYLYTHNNSEKEMVMNLMQQRSLLVVPRHWNIQQSKDANKPDQI